MNGLVQRGETESTTFWIKNVLPLGVNPAEAGIQDNMEFNFVFDAINPSCNFLKYLNINWDYFESKISSYSGLDSRLRGNDAGARDAAPFKILKFFRSAERVNSFYPLHPC